MDTVRFYRFVFPPARRSFSEGGTPPLVRVPPLLTTKVAQMCDFLRSEEVGLEPTSGVKPPRLSKPLSYHSTHSSSVICITLPYFPCFFYSYYWLFSTLYSLVNVPPQSQSRLARLLLSALFVPRGLLPLSCKCRR